MSDDSEFPTVNVDKDDFTIGTDGSCMIKADGKRYWLIFAAFYIIIEVYELFPAATTFCNDLFFLSYMTRKKLFQFPSVIGSQRFFGILYISS